MKKTSRILAIVLALVLVLSTGAFAAWVSFQNDGTNNGVIPSPAPTGNFQVSTVQLPQGMYVGVDVPPVIDDSGYAYVLESAPTTTRLVKVDLANATIVTNDYWAGTGTGNEGVEIRDISEFQLSTPVIVGTDIYVASTEYVQKTVDATTMITPSEWLEDYSDSFDYFAYFCLNDDGDNYFIVIFEVPNTPLEVRLTESGAILPIEKTAGKGDYAEYASAV